MTREFPVVSITTSAPCEPTTLQIVVIEYTCGPANHEEISWNPFVSNPVTTHNRTSTFYVPGTYRYNPADFPFESLPLSLKLMIDGDPMVKVSSEMRPSPGTFPTVYWYHYDGNCYEGTATQNLHDVNLLDVHLSIKS